MSEAILPPAPGLVPITTDGPQTFCRRLPTRRAVISVDPPGVNGTTMRNGLTGQSALRACEERTCGAATATAVRPTKRRRFSMGPLLRTVRPIASGHPVSRECGDGAQLNQCA